MSTPDLIIFLVVGLCAGWIAGKFVGGGGFGIIGDLIVGVIGAFIGRWIFGAMGISAGQSVAAAIGIATIGAVILVLILRMVRKT